MSTLGRYHCARLLLIVITIGLTQIATAQIDNFTIENAGHFGGNVVCGEVNSNYAYLGQGYFLTVVDISADPPAQVAYFELEEKTFDLTISGNKCFIYLRKSGGLVVIDITNPLTPVQIGALALPENKASGALFIRGDRLYIGTSSGLQIVDVSIPANPTIVGSNSVNVSDVYVVNDVAFCTSGNDLLIFDISSDSPVELSTVRVPGARAVFANATHTFVAAGYSTSNTHIFDITDPENPQEVSVFQTIPANGSAFPTGVTVNGNTAYIGCINWLFNVDITDPTNPVELNQWESKGWVHTIQIEGSHAHLFQSGSSWPYRQLSLDNPPGLVPVKSYDCPWDVIHTVNQSDRLYVASADRLWRYDITVQDQPLLLGAHPQWANMKRLAVQDNYLYAISDTDLRIFDGTNPTNFTQRSANPFTSGSPREIAVKDDYAYVLVEDTPPRLEILDITSPVAAITRGQVPYAGIGRDIFIHDNTACIVYSNGDADRGVQFVNITDPYNPTNLGNFQTSGDPTSVWVDDNTAFIGSNTTTYHLQSVDLTDPTNPTALHEVTGNGIIRDIEVRGGVVFTGVQGGSVHPYRYGPFEGFQIFEICPSPNTVDITVTPPSGTTTTSSGAAYTTEGQRDDTGTSGSEGIVIQRFIILWGNQGGLVTTVRPKPEAGTATPPSATGPIGNTVQVTAEPATGWAFTHWVNATPSDKKKAFAVLADPPTEAVAHFAPTLTLSPGPLNPDDTKACPAVDDNDSTNTPIIQIQLTASPADNWEISSVGFVMEGNLAANHVRRVHLRLGSQDGPLLTTTNFTPQFSLAVPPPFNRLSAGSGITFMITFDFEDKEAFADGTDPIQFIVYTNRNFIGAVAEQFPPGVILPVVPPVQAVAGGPILVGCVYNLNTEFVTWNIQDNINAATTLDNHRLLVCPGTYPENVDVTKSLTIQSMRGADHTTVQAETQNGPGIKVNRQVVVIDGFTVSGASQGEGILILQNNASIKNSKITQNRIGVNLEGQGNKLLKIDDSEIISNTQEGVSVSTEQEGPDSLVFNNVKINNNQAWGIYIAPTISINGNAIEISGNQNNGIAVGENLRLRASNVVIENNQGWGITNEHEVITNGVIKIYGSLTVKENHQGGIRGNTLEIAPNVIIEKNKGNGLDAYYDITADGIKIRENDGMGIRARRNITISGDQTQIKDNKNQGIHSTQGDISISGDNVVIDGNHGDGILALNGDIYVTVSGIEIKNNKGWGVNTWQLGVISINPDKGTISFSQLATITGNTSGGIRTDKSVDLAALSNVSNNGGMGIVAQEALSSRDLWVRGNKGTGINSGVVTLSGSDNRITGNQGTGIECTHLTMRHQGNMIADNTLWGIYADIIEFSHPINIMNNTGGGIRTVAQLNLPDNFVVDFNGGVGIYAVGGLTARNLKVENNTGDGIQSFGSTVLRGSGTSISDNGGNGLRVASQVMASLTMQGGRVKNNGEYGIAYRTNTPPTLTHMDVSENRLGGLRNLAANDESGATIQSIVHPGRISKPMVNTESPGIKHCRISNNVGDGILIEGELQISIIGTNFHDNSGFGINNVSPTSFVSAQGNWWGDATGPDAGDGVSGNVDFSNWLTEPVSLTASAEWDTVYTPAGRMDSVLATFQNWESFEDVVTVTMTDDLGWTAFTPFALTFQDSAGADTLLYLTVPENTPLATENIFHINAVSVNNAEWTTLDSFLVIVYESNLTTIVIEPDTITLRPGQPFQFQANGLDVHENSLPVDITWTATGGTIDENGLFTAGNIEGSFQVTATDQTDQIAGTAVVIISLSTGLSDGDKQSVPRAFELGQNYPNPFNPETLIPFSVKERCHVRLCVYDIRGREIKTLVNEIHQPGFYSARFDAHQLPTGLYIYSIQMKDFRDVKKMVLME